MRKIKILNPMGLFSAGLGDVGAFAALLDNIWFFEVSWGRSQMSEGGKKPEVGCQRSEIRRRRTEVRGQKGMNTFEDLELGNQQES